MVEIKEVVAGATEETDTVNADVANVTEKVGEVTVEDTTEEEAAAAATEGADADDKSVAEEKKTIEHGIYTITYEDIFKKNDYKAEQGIMGLWLQEFGDKMSIDVRLTRSKQACVVAYDGDKVVGVSTMTLDVSQTMWCRIGYLRCMVAKNYRRCGIASELAIACKKVLTTYAANHPKEKLKAMGILIDRRQFGKKGNQPIWPKSGLVITGYNELGMQMRLAWLDNAEVDY